MKYKGSRSKRRKEDLRAISFFKKILYPVNTKGQYFKFKLDKLKN